MVNGRSSRPLGSNAGCAWSVRAVCGIPAHLVAPRGGVNMSFSLAIACTISAGMVWGAAMGPVVPTLCGRRSGFWHGRYGGRTKLGKLKNEGGQFCTGWEDICSQSSTRGCGYRGGDNSGCQVPAYVSAVMRLDRRSRSWLAK
jgi:hypothetical protein